jgi:hypothetical protein
MRKRELSGLGVHGLSKTGKALVDLRERMLHKRQHKEFLVGARGWYQRVIWVLEKDDTNGER